MNDVLRLIPVEDIYPHPSNPRTAIGDITELTASVAENGILQNLTVVPLRRGENTVEGLYTVVIGHRRLAAARAAGLTEVPCAVSDMDEISQIAAMLLENMQRSDLTVPEQAQGVQLMLDMGQTVAGISEKTGLSETTVRRRLRIAEYDTDSVQGAIERGATLQDFADLEKINDTAKKRELLEQLGTRDYKWAFNAALERQKTLEAMPEVIRELSSYATELQVVGNGYEQHSVIFFNRWEPNKTRPNNAGSVKYFYHVDSSGQFASLYIKSDKGKEKPDVRKKAREKEVSKCIEEAKQLRERAYELRRDFVMSRHPSAKYADIIHNGLVNICLYNQLVQYNNPRCDLCKEVLGLDTWSRSPEEYAKAIASVGEKQQLTLELTVAYSLYGDSDIEGFLNIPYDRQTMPRYSRNSRLEHLYAFLIKLGYQMSSEEILLMDGTHPCYSHK